MAHPLAARCAPLLLLALAAQGTAAVQTATPSPVYWDAAKERWRDIASNAYAAGQSAAYDYAAATVLIAYESVATTSSRRLACCGSASRFAGATPPAAAFRAAR